ncbi:MAG: DUF4249 domain-containing protein [Bacteroidota bacterium]
MMKRFFNIVFYHFILVSSIISIQSCETEIEPELAALEPLITVDAWLNSMSGEQVIHLAKTTAYFDSSEQPKISGASVSVSDNAGNTFVFDEAEPGKYTWARADSSSFITLNTSYNLEIVYEGDLYTAVSEARRSPVIDSIMVERREEELGQPEGYYAQFFAKDFEGEGDTYWIRTYKNDEFLSKPSEINIAYDAAFSAGGNFDGFTFINPIREGVNPFDEDENEEDLSPYVPGDRIRVEIWSTTEEAFYFLSDVANLTNREGGIQALFESPIYNTTTNVLVNNEESDKVVGFFNTSMVESMEKVIEEITE